MALLAKQGGGGDFKIAPQGQYAAVCYRVIDFGHQYNATYDKWHHKVLIGWELHGENLVGDGTAYMEDGKPFITDATFTLSLAENSNLRPLLEGWRGRPFTDEELDGFDISKLIGVSCMLTIQHDVSKQGKTFANVKQASPLLKSLEKPTVINPTVLFEIDPWNQKDFEALPEWMREKIKQSREYHDRFTPNAQLPDAKASQPPAYMDDAPPFDDAVTF